MRCASVPQPRARVTRAEVARLLDSRGRLARFLSVTAAPLGCGAVSVWLTGAAENTLHEPSPTRGCSSAGRALHSHCRGQGFEPPQLHDREVSLACRLPMMIDVPAAVR